jgi:hypothetical protein
VNANKYSGSMFGSGIGAHTRRVPAAADATGQAAGRLLAAGGVMGPPTISCRAPDLPPSSLLASNCDPIWRLDSTDVRVASDHGTDASAADARRPLPVAGVGRPPQKALIRRCLRDPSR